MRRSLLVIATMSLTGCPYPSDGRVVIDLGARTATLTLRNWSGIPQDRWEDIRMLQQWALTKPVERWAEGLTVVEQAATVNEGQLDVTLQLSFTEPDRIVHGVATPKSSRTWCFPPGIAAAITETDGVVLAPALPHCARWDAKATTMTVDAVLPGRGEALGETWANVALHGVEGTKTRELMPKMAERITITALRKKELASLEEVWTGDDVVPADGWGVALRFQRDGDRFTLRSAGPDRAFDTPDDLVHEGTL